MRRRQSSSTRGLFMRLRFRLRTLFIVVTLLAGGSAIVAPWVKQWIAADEPKAEEIVESGNEFLAEADKISQIRISHMTSGSQADLEAVFRELETAATRCEWLFWMIERKRREQIALAALAHFGSEFKYEDDPHDSSPRRYDENLLGESFFHEVSWLSLRNTKIDDDGLQCIAGVANLEALELDGSRVTDGSVGALKRLPRLKELDLRFTRISDAGVAEIQKALPNCKIYH